MARGVTWGRKGQLAVESAGDLGNQGSVLAGAPRGALQKVPRPCPWRDVRRALPFPLAAAAAGGGRALALRASLAQGRELRVLPRKPEAGLERCAALRPSPVRVPRARPAGGQQRLVRTPKSQAADTGPPTDIITALLRVGSQDGN